MPGIILAFVIGVGSYVLADRYIPGVSGILLAIVIGAAVRSFGWVPRWAEPGLKRSAKTLLRLGIVLFGLQLVLGDILVLGWEVVAVVLVTVVVSFFGTLAAARTLRMGGSDAVMLATGTSICGASAVAGAAAALDRGDGRDSRGRPLDSGAAASIAVVTLWGTAAMLSLPYLAEPLGLDGHAAGVWIGAGVHEVGQVVAAGGIVGATALSVAVTVKLARVVLLAPVVAGISLWSGRRGSGATGDAASGERPPLVPGFVLGFLAMVLFATFVGVPDAAAGYLETAATLLLTVAMAAVGTGVDLPGLLRRGGPALLAGLAGTLVTVGAALGAVLLLVV